MMITITEEAKNKLTEMIVSEGKIPRIDAEISGGCGVSVKFLIVFDEPRRNDLSIEKDGIQLRLDRFTKRYLDEETQIDFSEDGGFLVGESFASSACAIDFD